MSRINDPELDLTPDMAQSEIKGLRDHCKRCTRHCPACVINAMIRQREVIVSGGIQLTMDTSR